jgi:hypothetical protein
MKYTENIQKLMKTCFFEKIGKIGKSLVGLTKIKEKTQVNKVRDEK